MAQSIIDSIHHGTTPRVGSAEGEGADGGITMLHLDLLQYVNSINATSVLAAIYECCFNM